MQPTSLFQMCLLLFFAVTIASVPSPSAAQAPPPPVAGADKHTSGCTSLPRGPSIIFFPKKICYRASVGIPPGTTNQFQFWMHVKNTTPAISGGSRPNLNFVVCAMINVDGSDVPNMERFQVAKTAGTWTFSPAGVVQNWEPNYHFACTRVRNLQPDQTLAIFDRRVTMPFSITAADLKTIYWDLLIDGPVDAASRDLVEGINHFLVPTGGIRAYNVWVGSAGFEGPVGLDPVLAVISWDLGNWVTMGYEDVYQAILVGRVFNASPGTKLVLTLGEGNRIEKTVDPNSFEFVAPFVIDTKKREHATLSLEANRQQMEEGQWVSFQAQVFATQTGLFYEQGDFMYSVAANAVFDTEPPIIDNISFRLDETRLFEFRALVRDSSSLPAAASVAFRVDNDVVDVFPLDFSNSALAEELMRSDIVLYEGFINYLENYVDFVRQGKTFSYQVSVVDEAKNTKQSNWIEIPPDHPSLEGIVQ